MSNAGVQILQELISDHVQTANAIRLPIGIVGPLGSPYILIVDFMKRWPASKNRHEVVMITDRIDRRGGNCGMFRGYSLNPDVDAVSAMARKTGTKIHSIYTLGNGRMYRNVWPAPNGQTNLAGLSEATGGMSIYLRPRSAVSFEPYFKDLQWTLNNQYLLSISMTLGKKSGLQRVDISTEVAGVDFASHDAVWAPAAKR